MADTENKEKPNEAAGSASGKNDITQSKKKSAAKKKDDKSKSKDDEKKEKKVPKGLSKMRAEIARQREEDELVKRMEEEEQRRIEEDEKKRLEEEKELQAKREAKKQKEKEKKERLKAEGKLLTDKQKEDKRKLLQMAAARGIVLPTDEAPKKRPQYTNKKKGKKQHQSVEEPIAEAPVVVEKEEAAEDTPEDSVLADWDDLADELIEMQCQTPEEVKASAPAAESTKEVHCSNIVYGEHLTDEEKTTIRREARKHIKEKRALYEQEKDLKVLRSGVICVLGHVDTGKTKILDKLRNTNVQKREAGGITQQIGATNVPAQNIREATSMCKSFFDTTKMVLPGLLIIDTPGHESFTNLRIRGSSLCDMAILVVDVMHSLEEQTKESIRILTARGTPFVVALNKIDRLYEFQSSPGEPVEKVLKSQPQNTLDNFSDRLKKVVADFAIMELNVRLFYDKSTDDDGSFIQMVPTSAHTGDGMGDLMAFICRKLETDLAPRVAYSRELRASVMEVKEITGLGMTVDVILVTGEIKEGDTIVLTGQEGPIVTHVRGLLQPAPMSEMRVKALNYEHHKSIKGAQGVKIIAKDLEKALAGLPLYVADGFPEELYYRHEVEKGLEEALRAISVSSLGVYVMASTIGSLESLLVYLKSKDIPYSGINVGTVNKKDVMKASVMIQRDPKWAVILAFDIKVDKEAARLAQDLNVRIFKADIIYHLCTKMDDYFEELRRENRIKHRDLAVFPVKLRIIPDMVFNKRAPIVMGVQVEAGLLKVGTPLCVPSREGVVIGKIFSIESNHRAVEEARAGQEVCIRVDALEGETPKLFGRHFDYQDQVVSKISRTSIDVMKDYFRTDLTKDDWRLMIELKKMLNII